MPEITFEITLRYVRGSAFLENENDVILPTESDMEQAVVSGLRSINGPTLPDEVYADRQ